MNTKKQRTSLKKYIITLLKVWKFAANVLEKSTKFFYGLEKRNTLCRTIKTLLDDGKEITTPSEISLTLKKNYENLIQKTITKSIPDIEMFLSDIHLHLT